jgi:hypothetical protein
VSAWSVFVKRHHGGRAVTLEQRLVLEDVQALFMLMVLTHLP